MWVIMSLKQKIIEWFGLLRLKSVVLTAIFNGTALVIWLGCCTTVRSPLALLQVEMNFKRANSLCEINFFLILDPFWRSAWRPASMHFFKRQYKHGTFQSQATCAAENKLSMICHRKCPGLSSAISHLWRTVQHHQQVFEWLPFEQSSSYKGQYVYKNMYVLWTYSHILWPVRVSSQPIFLSSTTKVGKFLS